jgi:hypothetical protein
MRYFIWVLLGLILNNPAMPNCSNRVRLDVIAGSVGPNSTGITGYQGPPVGERPVLRLRPLALACCTRASPTFVDGGRPRLGLCSYTGRQRPPVPSRASSLRSAPAAALTAPACPRRWPLEPACRRCQDWRAKFRGSLRCFTKAYTVARTQVGQRKTSGPERMTSSRSVASELSPKTQNRRYAPTVASNGERIFRLSRRLRPARSR